MKRLLLSFAVVPVLAFAQGSLPVAFLDVLGHPHESYIELLHSQGIVQGYGYGIFRPDILINRAEFLKILMLAAEGSEIYETQNRTCFEDFRGNDQWYWLHACAAKDRGIIQGYPDGTFRGEQPVNLAEALKIAASAWRVEILQSILPGANWYKPYMDMAADRGLLKYFPSDPTHLLTRSEMAYLIVEFGEQIAYVPSSSMSSSSSSSSKRTSSSQSSADRTLGICGNGELEFGEECDDGNGMDGDGCSSICVIVSEPIRHGALLIEQRSLGSIARAAGSKDITFIAFDATASRQDVWVTGLTVRAASGSLTTATGYRLLADTDGDGIAELILAQGKSQGSRIAFTDFQGEIPEGVSVRMEIHADLSPNISGVSLGLAFDTADAGFVSAVGDRDGEDLLGIVLNADDCAQSLCWIRVRTLPADLVTVQTVGSLYVMRDSIPSTSRLVLAGEQSDTLLRLTLNAVSEDITVRSLAIRGSASAVERLELFDTGSSIPFAIARTSQCAALTSGQFCTATDFTVKQGTERRVLVRAILKSDVEGALGNESFALNIIESTGAAHAVEARGVRSGADLSQNDGDSSAEGEIFVGVSAPAANVAITGPTHDVVLSKLGSIISDHGDTDETPVPVGVSTIAAFRFTALQNRNTKNGLNDVEIRTLVFTVSANNVAVDPDSFELFRTLDANVRLPCTADQSTLEITVTCSNISSVVASDIDAGQSITLALRAAVTNPEVIVGGSSLQVRLSALSDRSTLGTVEWHDQSRLVRWVDLPVTTVRSTLYRTR